MKPDSGNTERVQQMNGCAVRETVQDLRTIRSERYEIEKVLLE